MTERAGKFSHQEPSPEERTCDPGPFLLTVRRGALSGDGQFGQCIRLSRGTLRSFKHRRFGRVRFRQVKVASAVFAHLNVFSAHQVHDHCPSYAHVTARAGLIANGREGPFSSRAKAVIMTENRRWNLEAQVGNGFL